MFNSPSTMSLNEGQQVAANGFFEFLMDPNQKELHISGPGGVGKTFTMSHLIDAILPQYEQTCRLMGVEPLYNEVVMCATTNKAAAVLAASTGRPTQTVHSFFNLRVKENFKTGEHDLIQKSTWKVHHSKIIFIDEGSMTDYKLLKFIREGVFNCKIVWVSDHCQLPPVKEKLSKIYEGDLQMFELLQPMRNAGQQALIDLCSQVRETVLTGEFKPIKVIPGVIDLMEDHQMEAQLRQDFQQQTHDARVLCYTNRRVNQYNEYIRELRNLPPTLGVGEYVVCNSSCELGAGVRISTEEELTIMKVADKTEFIHLEDGVSLEIRLMDLQSYETYQDVPVPVDRDHFDRLVKYYAKIKNWELYFHLTGNYPDLRPRDACTVHKAQGSSYDVAYLDLTDISECRDPQLAARLLYVAVSRARKRIIMYGNLAPKFGGLILP